MKPRDPHATDRREIQAELLALVRQMAPAIPGFAERQFENSAASPSEIFPGIEVSFRTSFSVEASVSVRYEADYRTTREDGRIVWNVFVTVNGPSAIRDVPQAMAFADLYSRATQLAAHLYSAATAGVGQIVTPAPIK